MPGGTDQTLRPFLWRAERLYPDQEIVARTRDSITRYTYEEYSNRTAQLAHALTEQGLGESDRIGTFCWNHHRHFETYFGIPTIGAQIHTINPLLSDEHIDYIVGNASDQLLFLDPSLVGKLESARDEGFAQVDQYVVMGEEVPDTSLSPVTDYESFIAGHPTEYDWPVLDEDSPAGLCYTSGTTGQPKGVEYTHQMLWSHTMMLLTPQGLSVRDDDVVMPIAPMFHVNAWGLPFAATAAGAKHVYPGPVPESQHIARLIKQEDVTISAGVPTVWIDLFEYEEDRQIDLSNLDRVIVGGSAVPEKLIRRFDERDVNLLHAWGMTETSPVGTLAHVKADHRDERDETTLNKRSKQGLIVPGLEFKVIDDDGNEVQWNGEDLGELWIRGPWITTEYFERPDANEREFQNGWLKTGDIVTVDPDGYIEIIDRESDIIKSGGEWSCSGELISSVQLENVVMGHDAVSEAAVIGVSHEKWNERPVAFVVPTGGPDLDGLKEEIMALLRDEFPAWWLPERIEFIESIPKTATGKFSKKDLRDQYPDELPIEKYTRDTFISGRDD